MYQVSRSIYRELAPRVNDDGAVDASAARLQILRACEETVQRLVSDHRYFARPARTLFRDIRDHFPLAEQIRVYMVVDRYLGLVIEYLESLPDGVTIDGRPRDCAASTRRGTPCRREPRPGSDYCPSHRHLDDVFATRAEPLELAAG